MSQFGFPQQAKATSTSLSGKARLPDLEVGPQDREGRISLLLSSTKIYGNQVSGDC
jgi:hypothetical protein